jgi:hypothetical protein
MKKLILLISVLALAACSSKPKEEMTENETPVMTESSAAEAPAKADKTESMTADTGANMDGGFPDVEGTERSGATCKNGADERMVSVIDTKEGPCGVVYAKSGSKKTVAYAKNDMGYCDKVFQNIVGNLTSGGMDCGGAGAAPTTAAPKEEAAPAQEEAPAEEAQ